MERVALDTSFLIDLQNERRARGEQRGAIAFLRAHQNTRLALPAVALGEYLEGFDDPTGEAAQALVAHLDILPVTADVAQLYARVTRALRAAGKLIGGNDLWIACTAKAAGVPIVTRNVAHFRRVPGLDVLSYAG
jgi:tRNA(fMet)-specific endonuclease VapC